MCFLPGEAEAVEDELAEMLNLFPFRSTTRGPAVLTSYLLLGSADHAKDGPLLKGLGVTRVINCAEEEVGTAHYHSLRAAGIDCTGFSSSDSKDYDMMPHFQEVLKEVLSERENGGRCLVHCVAGVNRSGFLCIALLCELEGKPLVDAAMHARNTRGRVCTNQSFQKQLLGLAKLRGWRLR